MASHEPSLEKSQTSPLAAVLRRLGAYVPERIGFAPAMALVALLASLNFLVGLGGHRSVWDESYYLTSVERYKEGTAQFASHPPLALMLMAAGDAVLHPNRGVDTHKIAWDKQVKDEELPPHFSFVGMRATSGVFAVLGAVLFFALMYRLTDSITTALVFSNLYVFENSFITHFRAVHLDAFQIAFALGALLCFVIGVQRGQRSSPLLELTLGLALGLAIMVKVNVIVLLVLPAMLVLRRVETGWKSEPRGALLGKALRDSAIMAAGCFIAVASVYTVHVAVSSHPPVVESPAGAKDAKFISPTYWAYLRHQRPLSPAVVLAAAQDYTKFMDADFHGVTKNDSNGSHPLEWPLHRGTINYRWDSSGTTAYVQLVGNVFGWWLGLLAPFATVWLLALRWWSPRPEVADATRRDLMIMLLLQYLMFMAVHIYLGTERVMYLYHYFIGLLLTFSLLPLVLAEASDRWPAVRARQGALLGGMTALLLLSFVFYSPLSFHRPLTHGECELRNVIQHVVNCR